MNNDNISETGAKNETDDESKLDNDEGINNTADKNDHENSEAEDIADNMNDLNDGNDNETENNDDVPNDGNVNASNVDTEVPEGNSNDDNDIPTDQDILYEGQTFHSYPDFKDAVTEYQKQKFFYFTTRTSTSYKGTNLDKDKFPKKDVLLLCQHGPKIQRKPAENKALKSKQKRNYQSVLKQDCPVELYLSLKESQNSERAHYCITKFNSRHENHPLSLDDFKRHAKSRQLSEAEMKRYVQEHYIDLEANNRRVRRVILQETGKSITAKDLINNKARLAKKGTDIEETLAELQKLVDEDPNCYTEVVESERGTVSIIFNQPSSCKEIFKNYGSVLLIDTTYNLTNRGFKLLTISCFDNNKKTRLVAWALMRDENEDCLTTALNIFKEVNKDYIDKTAYIVIDKSVTEMAALFNTLPDATWIICNWHAKRAVEKKINSLHLGKKNEGIKYKFKDIFNKMIYETQESEYMSLYKQICTQSVDNLSGEEAQEVHDFIDYFEIQWHQYREHWACFALKGYKLRGTRTNNRAEAQHKVLKDEIKRQSSIPAVIRKLGQFQKSQSEDRMHVEWANRNKNFQHNQLNDEFEREIINFGNILITPEAAKYVLAQYKKTSHLSAQGLHTNENQTQCTRISGQCFTFLNLGVACSHLLFTRKFNHEILLVKEMFNQEWLLSKNASDENVDDGPGPSKRPKVAKAMTGVKTTLKKRVMDSKSTVDDISNLLSSCTDSERQPLLKGYQAFTRAANAGKRPFVEVPEADETEDQHIDNVGLLFTPTKKSNLKNGGQTVSKLKAKRKIFNDTNKDAASAANELESWQKSLNKEMRQMGCGATWTKRDFDVLCINKTEFVNDNHFEFFRSLLKIQFPNIGGVFDTIMYKRQGYPRVPANTAFIQPCHSGGMHWSLLSNVNVPQAYRNYQVHLHDSLVNFSLFSKRHCDVPSALEWQACQLILTRDRDDDNYGKMIEIKVIPCAQQKNSYDCGIFTMANAISLVMGLNPEDLVYAQGSEVKRDYLMELFKKKKLEMFETMHRQCGLDLENNFKRPTLSRIRQNVVLPQMSHIFTIICFCNYPKSFGAIVICDNCQKTMHQRCHLMGKPRSGKTIARQLEKFLCFSCRKPGNYEFLHQKGLEISPEDIMTVSDKINRMLPNKLAKFERQVLHKLTRSDFPSSMKEYSVVEKLLAKYDLNSVGHREGEIYGSIAQYYQNSFKDSGGHIPFSELLVSEIMHLAILLICECTGTNCPPMWPPCRNEQDHGTLSDDENDDKDVDDEEYDDVQQLNSYISSSNLKWVEKLQLHLDDVCEKIDNLCKKKSNVHCQDDISFLKIEIESVDNYAKIIIGDLEKAEVPNKIRTTKLRLVNQLHDIQRKGTKYSKLLNNFSQSLPDC